MKFLVNNKEYSEYLAHLARLKQFRQNLTVLDPTWKKSKKVFVEIYKLLHPTLIPGLHLIPCHTSQEVLEQYIINVVEQELSKWKSQLLRDLGKSSTHFFKYINSQYDRFSPCEVEEIQHKFNCSEFTTITKQVIQSWKDIGELYPRDNIDETTTEKLFIRNTVNNEVMLKYRMTNNLPFLFMDSGYTNFLESGKKWHRICENHIHNDRFVGKFNTKRMSIFQCLPDVWREGGNDIIVVEPSEIQCKLFDIDIIQWRHWIQDSLETHLEHPKRIIFREKVNKKVRQNFYQYLRDEDVYCVVNYNSNAAIESIWAGVPVLTLGKHISSPVSIKSVDQINNLNRPNLDTWLKRLSYSQYTLEEISNGTARDILENIIYV